MSDRPGSTGRFDSGPGDGELVTFTVSVAPGSEPIEGTVTPPSGQPRPFAGWLELAAALGDVTAPGPEHPREPA